MLSIERISFLFLSFYLLGHFIFYKWIAFTVNSYLAYSILILGLTSSLYNLYRLHWFPLLLQFIVWSMLTLLNPFVSYVSYPIMSVLLFLIFAEHCFDDKNKKTVFTASLLFITFHYTYIGLNKLLNPAWMNGSILHQLMFVSPEFIFLKKFANVEWVPVAFAGLTAILETLCFLLLFHKTRKFIIFFLLIFHVSIMLLLELFTLTAPYLLLLAWLWLHNDDLRVKPART